MTVLFNPEMFGLTFEQNNLVPIGIYLFNTMDFYIIFSGCMLNVTKARQLKVKSSRTSRY